MHKSYGKLTSLKSRILNIILCYIFTFNFLNASPLRPILKVTTPSPQALDPNNWMGKDLKLAKHLISPQLFTVAVFGAYRLPASLWFYRPERFATHAAAIDASSQELHNQQAVVESYKAMHNVDTIDESYKDLHKV